MGRKDDALVRAWKLGAKEARKREFEVAGQKITLPRLSLGRQAMFEKLAGVNLGAIRNKAAMAIAACVEGVLNELKEVGLPDRFENEEEYKLWAARFQAGIVSKWGPYVDAIFEPFNKNPEYSPKDLMLEALTLAFQQEYGTQIKDGDETIFVDKEFVDRLLSSEPAQKIETMFHWVLGLVNVPEGKEGTDAVSTLDAMVEQLVGNPKGSKKRRPGKSTTSSSSRSSQQPTDSG